MKVHSSMFGDSCQSGIGKKKQLQFQNIGKKIGEKIYKISIWSKKIKKYPCLVLEKMVQYRNCKKVVG